MCGLARTAESCEMEMESFAQGSLENFRTVPTGGDLLFQPILDGCHTLWPILVGCYTFLNFPVG